MVASASDYKQLSEIEHVIHRPGMYIGSIKPHSADSYYYDEADGTMKKKLCTWNPALLKLFDEVISNSVDESNRPHSNLNIIKVQIDESGKISVYDNGGIPVEQHETGMYVPELIFGELRAGSNFDDSKEDIVTGQNGCGSSLVNIFSTKFIVETADGKHKFKQTFKNNLHDRSQPIIEDTDKHYTKITFIPDYEKLNTSLSGDNYLKIVKRVYDIAGCNPSLKIYLNNKLIKVKSFKDYISMFSSEFIYDENENWKVGISNATDGFEHISFVNSTETIQGGTHISYITDQITTKLRQHFKKKHKIDVKPSEIRNHIRIFINANIINPRYSSQTKEDMITEVKEYKTSFEVTDKFINKIIKSSIIQDILDWVEAKANAKQMAELRRLNKESAKTNPKKIAKFTDATSKTDRDKCILYLVEGDCLDGNTKILTEKGIKKLIDVSVDDKVLTHKNRYKSILNIEKSVKSVIKVKTPIGLIIGSKNHKLLALTSTNEYKFIMLKNLTTSDKLVKNQLIETDIIPIDNIENIEDIKYDFKISFNNDYEYCTAHHKYFVYNIMTKQYELIKAYNLNINIHMLVIK